MADHILSTTKKCIPDADGRFFDSGRWGPYGSGETDYFIIRRTAAVSAVTPIVNFTFESWNVKDSTIDPSSYDFIDVFTSATGYPNSWTWVARLGGSVYNSSVFTAGYAAHIPAGLALKFCFSSKGGQDGEYNGWRIQWESSAIAAGANITLGDAASNYDDILDIKENCGDNLLNSEFGTDLFDETYFTSDPSTERWGYIPAGQLPNIQGNNIHILNQVFSQYNVYNAGGLQAPFSYVAKDQRKAYILPATRLDPGKDR